VTQRDLEGTSMVYAFNDADAPDQHTTQYFEIFGNRGIYHEGWTAVTKHRTPWTLANREPIPFESDVWELYDITADFSQARDLSNEHPERLAELQELFLAEARRFQVLPLDDRGIERMDAATAGRQVNDVGDRLTLYPGTRRLYSEAWPQIRNRSFVISASLVADSDRSDGVLVAIGNSFNGYSFYVREGYPVFVHNRSSVEWTHIRSEVPLPEGPHRVEYRFLYDGGGPGRGGKGQILIDGELAGSGRVEHTAVFAGGRLTIGANPGTAVTSDYARDGEYAYSGQIESITIIGGDDATEPPLAVRLRAEMVTH
jgi:arylsulfatase